MTVHSTDVRAGNADQGMFDGDASDVFRMLYRLLNAADGFIKFGNYALAQAAGFADAVAAITQSALAYLGHEDAGLGAAYINGR